MTALPDPKAVACPECHAPAKIRCHSNHVPTLPVLHMRRVQYAEDALRSIK